MRHALVLLVPSITLVGCPSPCANLNDVIVERYRECRVPLAEEREDGGQSFLGINCGLNSEEGACVERCWRTASCEDIAGPQSEVNECANACYTCRPAGLLPREIGCTQVVDTGASEPIATGDTAE